LHFKLSADCGNYDPAHLVFAVEDLVMTTRELAKVVAEEATMLIDAHVREAVNVERREIAAAMRQWLTIPNREQLATCIESRNELAAAEVLRQHIGRTDPKVIVRLDPVAATILER
jgi:hypothetical protein